MALPFAGRKGYALLATLLLVISILLEQYWLVRFFPWLSDLGGVQPMIIFLDIPLRLPVIDWLPVGILFVILYLVVISPELARYRPYRGRIIRQKGWVIFTRWLLLLICIIVTGTIYHFAQEFLPRQVQNGIDSFGFRADISVPWTGYDNIHLHGGMILLIAALIGGRFFLISTRLPEATPVAEAITEEVPARHIRSRIPDPVPVSVQGSLNSPDPDLRSVQLHTRPVHCYPVSVDSNLHYIADK